MVWQIEFDPAAVKELAKLDKPLARRIMQFLRERIAPFDDPRSLGEALRGDQLGGFWIYRLGAWAAEVCRARAVGRLLEVRCRLHVGVAEYGAAAPVGRRRQLPDDVVRGGFGHFSALTRSS